MHLSIYSSGKLALLGEIGVLFGGQAISLAVSKKMIFDVQISKHKTTQNQIKISSPILNLAVNKDNLKTTIQKYGNSCIALRCIEILELLKYNLNIEISILSKIPSGLGSSGAMISNFAALLFIIQKISNNLNQNKTEQAFHGSKFVKLTKENFAEIFTIGKGISEAIFGQNSSHVDIATSIYGNTILYQKNQTPQVIQKKYSPIKEIFLIPLQSPKKDVAFTLEVIKKNNSKDFSQNCFNKINAITKKTFLAMQNNQLEKLPKYINSNQTILESLSVFDPNARLIKKILKKQQITSFKVSGTGFGDFAFSLDKQIMRAKMQINKETIKVIREKVGTEIKIKLNY